MEEIKDFKFCKDLKCAEIECARHNCNTPYNIIITRTEFKNKNGKCEGYTNIYQTDNPKNVADTI